MVDQELNELKREFLAEAREKVEEIQQALARTPRSAEILDRLSYLAHQLKGAGGSYGYERISTDAAELEKALEKLADGGGSADLDTKINEHAGNLRAEIDRSAREL